MATSVVGNAYPLVVTLLHRGKFLLRFSAILILKLDLASSGGWKMDRACLQTPLNVSEPLNQDAQQLY